MSSGRPADVGCAEGLAVRAKERGAGWLPGFLAEQPCGWRCCCLIWRVWAGAGLHADGFAALPGCYRPSLHSTSQD